MFIKYYDIHTVKGDALRYEICWFLRCKHQVIVFTPECVKNTMKKETPEHLLQAIKVY